MIIVIFQSTPDLMIPHNINKSINFISVTTLHEKIYSSVFSFQFIWTSSKMCKRVQVNQIFDNPRKVSAKVHSTAM